MSSNSRTISLSTHRIGADGYFTLFLSNLVFVVTFGLYWLYLFNYVFRIAKHTPSNCQSADMIAVLGVRLVNDEISKEFQTRIDRGLELFEQGLANKILLVGGKTGDNTVTEAEIAAEYLLRIGLSRNYVLLEDSSRHTLENLTNARNLYLGKNGKTTAIVTSRYHLARSHVFAKQLKIAHVVCAAENDFTLNSNTVIKMFIEAYFLHWYAVGKIWAHAVNSEKSLNRIQ